MLIIPSTDSVAFRDGDVKMWSMTRLEGVVSTNELCKVFILALMRNVRGYKLFRFVLQVAYSLRLGYVYLPGPCVIAL
jgi:hypothetical protein